MVRCGVTALYPRQPSCLQASTLPTWLTALASFSSCQEQSPVSLCTEAL